MNSHRHITLFHAKYFAYDLTRQHAANDVTRLSQFLDAKTWPDKIRPGQAPLTQKAIVLLSHDYTNRTRDELKTIDWDLVLSTKPTN